MLDVHFYFIKRDGQYKKRNGAIAGNGLEFHVHEAQNLLWPKTKWFPWRELILKTVCENRIVPILGPASSGKTFSAAVFALTIYYANPDCCSVICTSTTREMLENRIFGEIKSKHKEAKTLFPQLHGQLIESRMRILSDTKDDTEEGRDFRNGIQGVATKVGGSYAGLGNFVGIKNRIVILIADELSLLPRVFVDAIANLNKNAGFKCIAMGNPLDITDALGVLAEPSAQLGGWDGGIDATGPTKSWPTRFQGGMAVQLVGDDSPNLAVPEDQPVPYPFLITKKAMDADMEFYGKESIQYSAMNSGRMPRGMSTRRVLTRQMCLRFGAMEEPIWKDTTRTKIGFLDAAYGGTGGDRCVFGQLDFGPGIDLDGNGIMLLALIDTMVVPIMPINLNPNTPEDQIAIFTKEQCEIRGIVPQNFFFDTTGRGSLMNAFGRIWSTGVVGIEFGGKPSERQVSNKLDIAARDYYANRVAELWYQLRLVVEARQFRGMTESAMGELTMREWGFVGANKIAVEPKDAMKVKIGRSPDEADAIVCGVEGALQRGFSINQMSKQNRSQVGSDVWKEELKRKAETLRKSWTLA